MPSGPGVIDNETIRRLARLAPPAVSSMLLTSRTSSQKVINHWSTVLTNAIQLVDAIPIEAYKTIRDTLPWIQLVQVIHVQDASAIEQALAIAPHVNAILLDSGRPNQSVKELGGTGRTHNWDISREIRERVNTPIFLAGGLNPDNVRAAIERVRPYGVDVCSGLRTDGKLDGEKVRAFIGVVSRW